MTTYPQDTVILHSMHMRSMLNGLSNDFRKLKPVKYIYDKLVAGERKFKKQNPKRYDELDEIKYQSALQYNRIYRTMPIATDTAITELYYAEQAQFLKYFKLKEKRFGELFSRFGDDDDLEGCTIEIMEWLIKEVQRGMMVFEFKRWVEENQKGYNV